MRTNPSLKLADLLVVSATTLDLLTRVSVLEGVAGVAPGLWMRTRPPANEIAQLFGPSVKDVWLSSKDSGLYAAVRRAIQPMLRGVGDVTADDIMQEALVGLGATGKRTRLPLFHGVGKVLTIEGIRSGALTPRHAIPLAIRYGKNRAIDVLRKERSRPPTSRVDQGYVDQPGVTRDIPSAVGLSAPEQWRLVIRILADEGHPSSRQARAALWKQLARRARPSDYRVLQGLVDGAKRRVPDKQVAAELGISGAAVSMAKQRLGKVIPAVLAKHPEILEPIYREIELHRIGPGSPWAHVGGGKCRWARVALLTKELRLLTASLARAGPGSSASSTRGTTSRQPPRRARS